MKNYFRVVQMLPNVYQIYEMEDVGNTLIIGRDKAFLSDAGYGFDDLKAVVRSITDLPLICGATHAHGDHLGAAHQFDVFYVSEPDLPAALEFSRSKFEKFGISRGVMRGIFAPDVDPATFAPEGNGRIEVFPSDSFDLGGLTVKVIPVPGHTIGSVVFYIPEIKTLVTGDDWNPQTTWLFGDKCVPLHRYISEMKKLLALDFEHLIGSHTNLMYDRKEYETFIHAIDTMTEADWMPYKPLGMDRTDVRYIKAGVTDFAFNPANL